MKSSPYSAAASRDIVRLQDLGAGISVAVKPSTANATLEMLVNGRNILFFDGSLEDFSGGLTGIPFMGPWANRLDEQAFYANGTRYALDMQLGNVHGAIPIHGFLSGPVAWEVMDLNADGHSAWVTSRLEFFRHPLWMKQFPFAHTIEMTHRLEDGVLEVRTTVANHSVEPMPVAIGFHPYFRLPDIPRADWTVSIGARSHWMLDSRKLPTGEAEPIEKQFPDPGNIPLRSCDLDDVYGDLVRDVAGRATVTVRSSGNERLDVSIGSNWRAVVVWAPSPREFICIEPMAGITNAMNLAHRGQYQELQSIPPSGTWSESFWIRPSGF